VTDSQNNTLKRAILAEGPWASENVHCQWIDEQFQVPESINKQADTALKRLEERGSPSHDGLAARLVETAVDGHKLKLKLQPSRWSLRLVENFNCSSLSVLCVTRSADGRWLAGRRAPWVASWAGRWALGAAGAVEVGENPTETLVRELQEEWSVSPKRLSIEGVTQFGSGMAMLVGQAWLAEGTEVVRDSEHDAEAWWPADPSQWPAEASEPLRAMAMYLSSRDK